MVRCTVGKKGACQTMSKDSYEELCKSSEVYEVPPMDTPIKLFCDIDIYDKEFEFDDAIHGVERVTEIAIEKVEGVIRELGFEGNLTYTVCDSSSPNFKCSKSGQQRWKISRHIVFENVLATKPIQGVIFRKLNEDLEKENDWKGYFPANAKFFDVSVYYVQKFRAVHSSKEGENRPLTIVQGTFEGSVLSEFFQQDCHVIDENHELFSDMNKQIVKPPISMTEDDRSTNEFLVSQYIEKGLLDKYANHYQDWFKIFATICNMFEEGTAWRLGDAFSRRAISYDECGNLKMFHKLLGNDKGYGIQHIRTHAQKADKKVYAEIELEKKQLVAKQKEEQKRLKMEQIKQKHEEKKQKEEQKKQKKQEIKLLNSGVLLDGDSVTTTESDTEETADNDADAGLIIYNKLKDVLVFQKGQLFFKNNNIWEYDADQIKSHLMTYILNCGLKTPPRYSTDEDEIVTIQTEYCNNVTRAKNVYEVLIHTLKVCDNVDIYEKFHTTTKNRLCFEDGVLDFETKKFYLWDEIDFEYYTTTMIRRPFANYFQNHNRDDIKKIHDDVFTNLFGEKTQLAYHFFSRAITANVEDKLWATYLGNRDCGKGVLYDLFKNGFQDYVETFELGNLLCQRLQDISEVSRKLYWLIDLQFTRIAISQETPKQSTGLKLMGKMIKKLAGGGDEHVARRNYDRVDTHFKSDATFMMMGNDDLVVDTEDANQKRVEFSSVIQFKSQEQIDTMISEGVDSRIINKFKVRDNNIKNLVKEEKYGNAIVMLLFEKWKPTACEFSREEEEFSDELGIEISKKFEFTTNVNDMVMIADLKTMFEDYKKVISELQNFGCKKIKSTKGEFRNKWVMTRLKRRIIEEIE
jgi:hypothetical protein